MAKLLDYFVILVHLKNILTAYGASNCTNNTGVSCSITQKNIHIVDNYTLSQYQYDVTIAYKCNTNFQFLNVPLSQEDFIFEKVSRCGSDGNWYPPIIDCVALCPKIPVWRGFIVDKPDRIQDTTIRYTCWGKYAWYLTKAGKYQYKFQNGNAGDDTEYSSSCSANGTWIPPIEECIEIVKNSGTKVEKMFTVVLVAAIAVVILN